MLTLALSLLGVSANGLKSSYETTVDMHISEIMPVFLDVDFNHEWAERLMHQEMVRTKDLGSLCYQQHKLPWPLSPRDLLLSCDIRTDARSGIYQSECHSVEHPSMPSPTGFVRLEMERTFWRLEALPGGRTKLGLEMAVPMAATAGVPKSLVNFAQRTSLRDSVTALIAAVQRLHLPPAKDYVHWRRTRAEVVAAARVASVSDIPSMWMFMPPMLALGLDSTWLAFALLGVHCVVFALLARWWWARTPVSALSAGDTDAAAAVRSNLQADLTDGKQLRAAAAHAAAAATAQSRLRVAG